MDEALLKILACPKCKGELEYNPEVEFVCRACGLAFRIQDGIPNFLIEEARPLNADDAQPAPGTDQSA
jgi:hypothetical protein